MNSGQSEPEFESQTATYGSSEPGAGPADASSDGADLRILDSLESDLLAVEAAITTLDEVVSGDAVLPSGESVESAIRGAVPHARFGEPG